MRVHSRGDSANFIAGGGVEDEGLDGTRGKIFCKRFLAVVFAFSKNAGGDAGDAGIKAMRYL